MGEWIEVEKGVFMGKPTPEEFIPLMQSSNIPLGSRETHRIETWKHKTKETWWDYIKEYGNGQYKHPFLTILGQPGLGKTHLAIGIGFEWLSRAKTVLYYQSEAFMDALRDGYKDAHGEKTDYQKLVKFASVVGLFILDDLGAEHQTDWALSKLDQVIDTRYINRKATIATTNMSLDKLPPRIADRLAEGVTIHITGQSYRRKKEA